MSGHDGFDELVVLLSAGISQRRLYFGEHPKVVACSEEFTRKLHALLAGEGKESLFLGIVDGKLVHKGHYLVGSSIVGRKLIDCAGHFHCGGFLFQHGVEPREVRELFTVAAQQAEPLPGIKEARALLEAHGVRHVTLSPPYEDAAWFGQFVYNGEEAWGGNALVGSDISAMLPVYQSLFGAVESAHRGAAHQQEPDLAAMRGLSEKLLQSTADGFMDMMQVVRYPDYDSYTVGHSVRVAMIAVLVGRHLGLPPELLAEVGTAGLLHDVGKACVAEGILYKPEGLTLEERRLIQQHPVQGARILIESHDAGPLAVAAAWGHHLRHDGGGYPACAPWAARGRITDLLHVCDVYEALTAVRPYKLAMTPRRAYEVMLRDGGQFDPALLASFVSAMGIYPPGSRVRLSTGEEGIVVAVGAAADRPRVRIARAAGGELLPADEQFVLDLASPEAGRVIVSGFLLDDATAAPDAPDLHQPIQSTIALPAPV